MDELNGFLGRSSERSYRAKQIFEWVYKRLVDDFDAMRNLPAPLRQRLAETYSFGALEIAHRQKSGKRVTEKFLLQLPERDAIEAVFMRDHERVTYCISSQAGCPLACRFCATGYSGFTRNLTTAEIVEQIHVLARTIAPPHNIVYMGMGEPLLNVGNVMRSIQCLTDREKFGLSPRRITVSTVGIVPGIERLATLRRPVNLALSLHATNDALRQDLMPINRQYPLDKVLAAARGYIRATDRRVTIEYIMIGDVNIGDEDARALAKIASGLAATVNLLAYNPVDEADLRTPSADEEGEFRDRLRALGVNATIRFRRGRDIQAACGQLRGKLVEPRSGIAD